MRRLEDLKCSDRWFGARWATAARERVKWLAGPEHTGAKLIGLLAAIALAVLIFGHWNYRVEAPFSCAPRMPDSCPLPSMAISKR